MIQTIQFSRRASISLERLLEYLEKEWSKTAKENFIRKLDYTLMQIKKHPNSFPCSEKILGLRRCVITKQTTIFYKHDNQSIIIIAFFDNRQDPNVLKAISF